MIHQSDILLDGNDELLITNGDLTIGDSVVQEVGIITRLNQGELKSDPLLGPGLIRLINSRATGTEVKTLMKVHLARDGKSYDDIKEIMAINGSSI